MLGQNYVALRALYNLKLSLSAFEKIHLCYISPMRITEKAHVDVASGSAIRVDDRSNSRSRTFKMVRLTLQV